MIGLSPQTLFYPGALGLEVSDGERSVHVSDPNMAEAVLNVACELVEPHENFPQLASSIAGKIGSTKDVVEAALSIIQSVGGIVTMPFDREQRYSRSWLYYLSRGYDPHIVQERLSNSHVYLWGAGGIGNALATQLVLAGLGRITIADYDSIEITNLNRQFMFTEGDLGSLKTEVLCRELKKRNSQVIISAALAPKTKAEVEQIPSDATLVVLAADWPVLRDWVNSWACRSKTPWISVGYIGNTAAWGPLIVPGSTGCFKCHETAAQLELKSRFSEQLDKIAAHNIAPSTGPINGLAASSAAFDIIKYLGKFDTPLSLGRAMYIETSTFKQSQIQFHRNPLCLECGKL